MIPYIRLHLHFEFESYISSYFVEALIRGAMGYKLRNLICINKKLKDCRECLIKKTCAFALIYAAEPDEGERVMETQSIPPPVNFFIYKKGVGTHQFIEMTLFKPLFNYTQHILFALFELGKEGIGRDRVRFEVKTVTDSLSGTVLYDGRSLTSPEIYEAKAEFLELNPNEQKELTVEFVTPFRLKRNNTILDTVPFNELIKSSLIRYSILSENYGDGNTNENAREIIEAAGEVELVASELKWMKHERYSSRQERKVAVSGITGTLMYRGNISQFMDIVRFGSTFGIGKSTSFGAGRFGVV